MRTRTILLPVLLSLALVTSGCGLIEDGLATLSGRVLAKAEPDECFVDIGDSSPIADDGTCEEGTPKVNQAYVWGLTKAKRRLWYGTGPNVVCLVLGALTDALGDPEPMLNDSWACEYGEGPYGDGLPAAIGDWRPPQLFFFDTLLKRNVEITPNDPLIDETLGIRAAGSDDRYVFLGGPAIGASNVHLFFYHAQTGMYLGSRILPGYNNIRKALFHDGVLYVGVGRDGGGGALLRANREHRGSPDFPFSFEEIVTFDGDAVELTEHDGALVVATWPGNLAGGLGGGLPPSAGLWMSPPIPEGGLTPDDAAGFQKIWEYTDYDPDLITGVTTGTGALASYGGYLFWGTMHVPLLSTVAHLLVADSLGYELELLDTFLGSFRAIAIFRGSDLGTESQNVELLYGEKRLSALNLLPVFGGRPPVWEVVPNKMGATPLYGSSGFGNSFLNYTWTMNVFQDQLYVGTMDWGYLFSEFAEELAGFPIPITIPEEDLGADLWRFPAPDQPAVAESINGVGNETSYGIRTTVVDDKHFYLGMANPMNLRTDPALGGVGGWELIDLFDPSELGPPGAPWKYWSPGPAWPPGTPGPPGHARP